MTTKILMFSTSMLLCLFLSSSNSYAQEREWGVGRSIETGLGQRVSLGFR